MAKVIKVAFGSATGSFRLRDREDGFKMGSIDRGRMSGERSRENLAQRSQGKQNPQESGVRRRLT